MKNMLKTLGLGVVLLAGCSTAQYRASADKETAAIIAAKGSRVSNMDPHFTIEPNAPVSLTGLPVNNASVEFFGAEGKRERGVPILSLEKALAFAVKHNRAYQSAKEQVYLSALSLTLSRYQFTPIFSSSAEAG